MTWISVKDRLPDKNKPIVVWVFSSEYGSHGKVGWRPDEQGNWNFYKNFDSEVTHWAPNVKSVPLPLPPVDQEDPWELCTCDCTNECCCTCGAYEKQKQDTNKDEV